jgi:hypothetical protein
VGVFASFFQVLHSAMVSRDRADRLWWVSSKKSLFKVKSSRAAFFAWSATLGKTLTMDNLRKRHIIIVDRCCLCKRDEEFVDRILFTVMWLSLCGITYLLGLVCLGLCLEELTTYLPVGGSLKGQGVLRFGR